jgi:hypothetical protein
MAAAPYCALRASLEVSAMSTFVNKDDAHRLVDQLPANATWDDLMHEIYVRETIESGLADSTAGRTKGVEEIRRKYGLPE